MNWMITTARFSLYLFSLLRSNFFQNSWSIHFIIHGQCASVELWIHGGGCYVQQKGKSRMMRWQPSVTLATWVLSNFPSSSVSWCMHTNHEPVIFFIYNIRIVYQVFISPNQLKAYGHAFQWLYCVSKLLGWIPWLCYYMYLHTLPHGSPIAVSKKCWKSKQFTSLCFPAEEREA